MGDYSRFLTKMAELKAIQGEYNQLSMDVSGAVSTDTNYADDTFDKYNITPDKNPISNTKTPLVIAPGEDYADFWKYIGKITPVESIYQNSQRINAQKCWNLAANDPRLFKKVVYTGNNGVNIGQPKWDNLCYGLVPDAPASVSYDSNDSTGYAFMVGNGDGSAGKTNGIYTKLGINPSGANAATVNANVAKASKLYDLQLRVNSLTQEITAESETGINNELNTLVSSAAGSNELISKINDYMNDAVGGITSDYNLVNKRKDMNNVYSEINEQTTLRARKYGFIFFIVITISIIIGYGSYTSKMSLLEQIGVLKNYVGWGWWTNWGVIAIVVIVFIISSFGWDMRGNISMIIRYVTDPAFWTGQLWWVGVTFLLLIMIFFYATFKSFFMEFDAGMKSIQSSLDGDSGGNTGDAGAE
jgi:hypothetical protein